MSQKVTLKYLDEIIDFVPLNKITGFGGDYRCVVQKIWGHLVIARQTVSQVLGKRVDEKDMSLNSAIDIADMFFYHNPKEIYNLNN